MNYICTILKAILKIISYIIFTMHYLYGILYIKKYGGAGMGIDSNYFKSLLSSNKASKKQVAVYLDERKLERIDMLIKVFSSLSESKSFSRNMIIEEAVEKYLSESEDYLKSEHGIDIGELIEQEKSVNFDTVILSSIGTGFEDVFMGEKEEMCWYPCRISEPRQKQLKYISIYRGAPVSGITHYAEIKEFKYDPGKKCKVCYFNGEPRELPNKITLGGKDSCFFVGAKYTKLEQLLSSKTASELNFY